MTARKAPKAAKVKRTGVSRSSIAVAKALTQHYPKDAGRIVQIMGDAALSKSMKRKLARVAIALEKLKGGQS